MGGLFVVLWIMTPFGLVRVATVPPRISQHGCFLLPSRSVSLLATAC